MPLQRSQILEILTKKLGHNDYDLVVFTLENIQAGSGMMGEHLRLECHITLTSIITNITQNLQEIHSFFVKKQSPHKDLEDISEKVFYKEIATYNLLQLMPSMVTSSIAELYYTDSEHMVFEDLLSKGYILQDSQKLPTEKAIFKVLESLAGIHAGSIIYEETQRVKTMNLGFTLISAHPEAFAEYYLNYESIPMRQIMTAFIKGLSTALDIFKMPVILDNGREFRQELERFWEIITQYVKPSKKYRNVLCHCDLWAANLFLRKKRVELYDNEEEKEEVLHAKIIDYQITRYLPPAADVLDVVVLNTSREYRKNNLEKLQKWYFHCFCQNLKVGGVEPREVYTWEEFLESLKGVEFFGIFKECFTLPLAYVDKEKFAQMMASTDDMNKILFEDRSPLMTNSQDNDYFMARVKDCILDLKDYFEEN